MKLLQKHEILYVRRVLEATDRKTNLALMDYHHPPYNVFPDHVQTEKKRNCAIHGFEKWQADSGYTNWRYWFND